MAALLHDKDTQVNLKALFYFQLGQLVIWCPRYFSKLNAKATGPFVIHKVAGLFDQRVKIEGLGGLSGQGKWTHPF